MSKQLALLPDLMASVLQRAMMLHRPNCLSPPFGAALLGVDAIEPVGAGNGLTDFRSESPIPGSVWVLGVLGDQRK